MLSRSPSICEFSLAGAACANAMARPVSRAGLSLVAEVLPCKQGVGVRFLQPAPFGFFIRQSHARLAQCRGPSLRPMSVRVRVPGRAPRLCSPTAEAACSKQAQVRVQVLPQARALSSEAERPAYTRKDGISKFSARTNNGTCSSKAEPPADNRQTADRYRAGPPALAREASEGCRAGARSAKAGICIRELRLGRPTPSSHSQEINMSTLHKRGRLAAAPIRTLCRLDPERTKPGSAGHGTFNPAAGGSSPPGSASLRSRSERGLPRRSAKREGGHVLPRATARPCHRLQLSDH
jgi:hypothetical protein